MCFMSYLYSFVVYLYVNGSGSVRVTYAERMPGVIGASTKFIDFIASHISGRFIRDLSNKPSVSLIIITICAHTLVSTSILTYSRQL